MSKAKILVIVGTVRQGRSGLKVANWYLSEAKKLNVELDFELLDLAELKLPIFDAAIPPAYHQYNDIQNKIASLVGAADGFIFVTAEYNHTVPGSLVNFLDYINAEWGRKPAAFVGYGSQGGVRSIEHLIQILAELGVVSVARGSNHVLIRAPWESLDETGVPKADYLNGTVKAQLEEFSWWVKALKAARA